jgi:hypothetical protein
MGLPPHRLNALGAQLRQLLSAGATPLMLGRFAVRQVEATGCDVDAEALGLTLLNAHEACADDGVLGRFAALTICEALHGSQAPEDLVTASAVPVANPIVDREQEPISEQVRRAVRQELAKQRRSTGSDAVRFARLKLQTSEGKWTTVAVPRQLLQTFVSAFGEDQVKVLLQGCAGPLQLGAKRSGAVQAAMAEALQTVPKQQGGALRIVPKRA